MSAFYPEKESIEWHREIQDVKEQLARFEQDSETLPSCSCSIERQAIGELARAIEELQVAVEEIQLQNQELLVTRHQLEKEQKRYQDLFNYAPDGYLVTNDYGIILEANAVAINMLGISAEYINGKSLELFVDASSRKHFRSQWLRLSVALIEHKRKKTPSYSQPNQSEYFQVDLRPRGGEKFPALMSVCGTYEPQNDSIELRWMLRDLSEYYRAQTKIREQAALLDIANDAIIVRDLKLQILYWNRSAERIYGWQAEEALGKNSRDLFKIGSQIDEALKETIEQGQWRGELKKITKSDRTIVVESHWTLVRDEACNPKSILTVETDITEKKQIQEQLIRSQSLEKISMVASGLSHDLNNIFSAILGAAQLLSEKFSKTDDRSQELMKILESNVERGSALLSRIVSISRQNLELKLTEVQIANLLREVEQTIKEVFPKSIELRCEIPSNLWRLRADITQLHQMLINLVINARDAMPDGGILELSAANMAIDENYARSNPNAKVGMHIVIKVSDTGMGIPPEILEQIFEPFFTTKEVGKGTGLGLASVFNIVKSHDGFLEVTSKLGQGTEFRVFLPAANFNP